jgi:hypothetical protein
MRTPILAAAAVATLGLAAIVAAAPSGAIFTTVADGSEVNYNHYAAKTDVYLDGGPGPGAPQHAAALPDGRYVFMVTDPSGKVLLSTDPARCREFDVVNGIISNVVPTSNPGAHKTGQDIDHNATTVQLYPFLDTPNNGGVYKAWVTPLDAYLAACARMNVHGNVMNLVDPGSKFNIKHGFEPSNSKTDNFKVKEHPIVEIDTRFYDRKTKQILDGLQVTWIDTNGASNTKSSYEDLPKDIHHEAHVEAVEIGTHQIVIQNQPGYNITYVRVPGGVMKTGPQTVPVNITDLSVSKTIFIDVYVN